MTNSIEQAFSAFEAIDSTTSRTEKESILKNNKDNEVLQQLLVATYNPYVVYGIKKDPEVTPTNGVNDTDMTSYSLFMQLLEDLSERRLTGNNAITAVKNFFENCSQREYKWYLKVLQRDLKIGITEKTINKVWKDDGGLVPVFVCALANSFAPKKMPKRFVADTKLDGYRCLAFNYANRVELRTRNGHLLEGYFGIEKDVADYLPKGFVYDGEILGRQGTFNEVQKSAFKKVKKDKKGEPDKDGVLNVFDVVSIKEFENNDFKVPYKQRIAFLDQITDILEGARSLARVYQTQPLDSSKQEDMDAFILFHVQNVERGEEGTMAKDLDAVYKMGKSNNILKMKDFYDIDLEITGVYEGSPGTKYVGVMGGVTVELSSAEIEKQLPIDDPKHKKKLPYIKGATFTGKVGSGWSDADRVRYWENPNEIIGKTLEISFQELTINDKNEHNMRFPTVVKIRDDK